MWPETTEVISYVFLRQVVTFRISYIKQPAIEVANYGARQIMMQMAA